MPVRQTVEMPGPASLRLGPISPPRVLRDVRHHPRIPDRLSVLPGIEPRITVALRSGEVEPHRARRAPEVSETVAEEDDVVDVHRSDRDRREDVPRIVDDPDRLLPPLVLVAGVPDD